MESLYDRVNIDAVGNECITEVIEVCSDYVTGRSNCVELPALKSNLGFLEQYAREFELVLGDRDYELFAGIVVEKAFDARHSF